MEINFHTGEKLPVVGRWNAIKELGEGATSKYIIIVPT